jgi:hypothetical protein
LGDDSIATTTRSTGIGGVVVEQHLISSIYGDTAARRHSTPFSR